MPRYSNRTLGFTLIEMMVVATIVGVLAAVAFPKFADLIRKSREGAEKGGLGAIRSALSVYYSSMEGIFPSDDLSSLTVNSKFIPNIPISFVLNYHPPSNSVYGSVSGGCGIPASDDSGRWMYWNDVEDKLCSHFAGHSFGDLWVSCQHTDSKGSYWTMY